MVTGKPNGWKKAEKALEFYFQALFTKLNNCMNIIQKAFVCKEQITW